MSMYMLQRRAVTPNPLSKSPQSDSSDSRHFMTSSMSAADSPFSFLSNAVLTLSSRDESKEMRLRIIPLDQDLTLMKSPFRVRIVNPQNITVQRFDFKKGNDIGIITKIYKFPRYVLEGIWGVSVEHGHEVKISVDKTIMEDFQNINGKVSARYVYDKPLKGVVRLRYGVKAPNGEIVYIPDENKVEVVKIKGEANFAIPLKMVKDKFQNKFPLGHKFHVEATVVEGVSGKEFTEIDENSYFQKSPYIISFAKTVTNFKIGLVVYIQVLYASKAPAKDVKVLFTVKTADGDKLAINNNERKTDESGIVQLSISVPSTTKLTVEVVTNDDSLTKEQQGHGRFVLTPYVSPTGGYLGIKPTNRKLKKGDQFDGTIIVNPWQEVNRVMFSVIGKGKVLLTSKTSTKDGKNTLERTITFKVTDDMIPSIRVVAFANYKGQLIADSIWLDVEDMCQHDIETSITPHFDIKQPGEIGNVVIKAAKKSIVGLLTVDKAVYVLRNEGRLTADTVYDTMEGYDIGCGAGGGRDSANVLEKSGVIILTSSSIKNEKRDHFKCNDVTRKKREIEESAEAYQDPFIKSCCVMGQKPSKFKAPCSARTSVLRALLTEKYPDKIACADAFYNCCSAKSAFLARTGDEDLLDFVEDLEAKEAQSFVRSFFPESWLYEEWNMKESTEKKIAVNLPHSITTWVFQAVSVLPNKGLCIAKPEEIVVRQGIFLDVSIPYSIVRNEEVEIKVTVFNYLPRTVPVTVYLYGVEGLCTGAQPGKRTEKRLIYVPKKDAISTGFYIIPLKVGDFKLRVVALSEVKSDVIVKTLNVRAEGITQYKDRTTVLDPANYNGILGSSIVIQNKDGYSYFSDGKNKKLVVSLPVVPPMTSIPDTESATIYIIGDSFGPTVKTAFTKKELGRFINQPRGCGEQNMMLMAPCLYTMKYLAATGKIGAKEEKVGYDWIRLGYERELNYRRKDGETFINIDEEVGCTGLQWLVNNQNKDGSFTDKAPVYHQEMTGGAKGAFPITAFVLMSLYECTKCKIEGMAITKARAIDYLENNISNKKRPYELAVAVYALTLAKSPKQKDAIRLLKQSSIFNRNLDQRQWEKGTGALSVEATAYGLLTMVLENDMPYAKAIVNWLNANRGFGGVWKSTQVKT
ncbi:A.superbus venom factor 1 [Nymphon striatum]|nr:A.superbus venom factor 1 [Nymphon striatum]